MAARVVAVAYSGGRDSTALLHATVAAAERLALEVVALHVHHGLSVHADAWQAGCERLCGEWAAQGRPVRCVSQRISGTPPRGASIEAWARDERYAALRRMALDAGAEVVLLAQHRRDQAETFLLQALRGAGAAGLAAMPAAVERDGICWLRPWLARPREAIETYLKQHGLESVDDDSNTDRRYARNRLRLDIWPPLLCAFADAEAALATAAERAQEAAAALAELAALDLQGIAQADGFDIAAWSTLSAARRGNALRAWLKQQLGRNPGAKLAQRLMTELATCRTARWSAGDGELQLYRGVLRHRHSAANATGAATLQPEATLSVDGPGDFPLPGWRGSLRVTAVDEGGIALERLAQLELRPRRGGERIRTDPGRPARSLKKQYQAAGVPAWDREGPLLYAAGRLLYVPGLGLDVDALETGAAHQVMLSWQPA